MRKITLSLLVILLTIGFSQNLFSQSNKTNLLLCLKNKNSLKLASILYPQAKRKIKKERGCWSLSVRSSQNFRLNVDNYEAFTWNETHHPNVSTQAEVYNYGGMLLLKNNKVLSKIDSPNLNIEKIIIVKQSANILVTDSFYGRSYAEGNITNYLLKNGKISQVFSYQILDSDLVGAGTYHIESEITYSDLNNDSIEDITIQARKYKIEDNDKTDIFEILKVTNILMKESY